MNPIRIPGVRYWAPAAVVGVVIAGSAVGEIKRQNAAEAKPPAARAAPQKPAAIPASQRLPGYNADRNAYFGDLHVHTQLSFDAYIFNVRRTPDDAYRFARGEAIGHAGGFTVRLAGGPLDFVAVTDHAEYMGAISEAANQKSPLSKLPIVRGLFSTDPAKITQASTPWCRATSAAPCRPSSATRRSHRRAWTEVQDLAARNNQSRAIHDLRRLRVHLGARLPEPAPQRHLPRQARPTCRSPRRTRAIPRTCGRGSTAARRGDRGARHPAQLERLDGQMFDGWRPSTASRSTPPTPSCACATSRWSRSPRSRELPTPIRCSRPTTSGRTSRSWSLRIATTIPSDRSPGGYVREALGHGLELEEKSGFNPFKFGLIGSSDTHNAAPGSFDETNYFSKVGRIDDAPAERGSVPLDAPAWTAQGGERYADQHYHLWGASGLAGVWAEENTRESIYDALRRKETFATSGPRMRVRFFAGYDFADGLASDPDAVAAAYAGRRADGRRSARARRCRRRASW